MKVGEDVEVVERAAMEEGEDVEVVEGAVVVGGVIGATDVVCEAFE